MAKFQALELALELARAVGALLPQIQRYDRDLAGAGVLGLAPPQVMPDRGGLHLHGRAGLLLRLPFPDPQPPGQVHRQVPERHDRVPVVPFLHPLALPASR